VPDVTRSSLYLKDDLCLYVSSSERSNPPNLRPGSQPPEIRRSPARESDPE